MAADQGPVSTAPITTTTTTTTTTLSHKPSTATATPPHPDAARSRSLKRYRPDSPQNPAALTSIANAGLGAAPSPKSSRLKGAFTPAFGIPPLPGPPASAREQRLTGEAHSCPPDAMSDNPGYKALSSLVAAGAGSRTEDAPGATTVMSDGLATAASAIANSSSTQSEDKAELSPACVSSLAIVGSAAQTATASPTLVASPAAMTTANDAEARDSRSGAPNQLPLPNDEYPSHRESWSYPGGVEATRLPRGLSLPIPGQGQSTTPRSPSQKKYKCQFCETEFTRQHNLKSHLLTHSHEKPYVCQTCNMRFRRLHDLKRHMKLHTGERPHVCAKCNRKFARGDALARHTKGQGGCAGRRASIGSYGGDDDYEGSQVEEGDENGMDGVMYTNGSRTSEAEMTEEERRRFSLPAIKAQHVSNSQDDYTQRGPSTYPPAGPRPGPRPSSQVQTGGLYPPNTDRGGGSPKAPSGGLSPMAFNTGGNSIFPQSGGMTESPKPLSPAGMISHQLGHDPSISRQRSPSLTAQFQQQHFGRHQSERSSPTSMSLPSPHPKLPALASLGPPEQRYNASGQPLTPQNDAQSATSSPGTMYQPPMGSTPGRSVPSGPSHQGSGSADGSNNLFAAGERGVWAYVQTLEDKVKQLSDKVQAMEAEKRNSRDLIDGQQDKINRLSDELISLRGNPDTQNQQRQPAASQPS